MMFQGIKMNIGDSVVVMSKDAVSGVARPSFAKVISVDDKNKKLLVESQYQTYGTNVVKWVTSSSSCLKVEQGFLNSLKDRDTDYGNFETSDLVMFVDKSHPSGDEVVEGVVVNVTPKTVEIMVNGTIKIQRKKKSLVMHLV
ncbi:MAG: hypothetical protein CMA72_07170 [Euryarchaeota archaeon]|nr:hypothetical protein [Euryarchaeota archaeon]|tara:strand:+ start:49647 stop:50072 length:426 start_codon:yes stop_codon:yes gene_type:complete